jgi:hypothetical protein
METASVGRKKAMETQNQLARRYDAQFRQNAVALVRSGMRME